MDGRGIRPVSIVDTEGQVCSEGTKPLIEWHHFRPVVYNNKIYIVGAMTGRWSKETPVSNVYIYETPRELCKNGDEIPEHGCRCTSVWK